MSCLRRAEYATELVGDEEKVLLDDDAAHCVPHVTVG